MNEAARNYFKTSDQSEIEEIYEQEIFELKQFFLSRAPIAKLFKGRIAKLNKLQEVFDEINSNQIKADFEISFPENSIYLLDSFTNFQAVKNKIRLLISNELNGYNLLLLVQKLIDLEKEHAKEWSFTDEIELDETVVVSKEPNPIDILNAINEYQQKGNETLKELKRNENNPPNVLIQEMKRLSLLFKKY